VALAGCGLLLVVLGSSAGSLHGQDAPVVQPLDVSTPTPGPPAFAPLPGLPQPNLVLPAGAALPDAAAAVRTYTVRPGDTLLSVALETGLDLGAVSCAVAPTFAPDQPLVIGDVLTLPPANTLCHRVEAGETIGTLAARYGTTPDRIFLEPWNRLESEATTATRLAPDTYVRVPLPLPGTWSAGDEGSGQPADFLAVMLAMPVNTSPFAVFSARTQNEARRVAAPGPIPADWPYGSGEFTWPVYGWLSQSYRYDHRALDVAAPQGTPVTAADRGVVVRAGWNDQGYGQFVVIDHQIDYITLYAHLDRILVNEGDVVGQGQVIGTVGSTGNSTGPHLHFEIRDFGRLANPLELLAR
jgi:murein DD-endopeptidase MepM/ murein hydrolase activator NlpD